MRSEQKRISGEAENQEAADPQLGRRLEQLGSRLQRDAERLAARYPAERPSKLPVLPPDRPHRPRSARITWLAAAVTLLVAASPYLLNSRRNQLEPGRTLASVSRIEVPSSDTGLDGMHGSMVLFESEDQKSVADRITTSAPNLETPVFLLEVSNPELEALLDLWEQQRTEPTRLSI